MTFPSFAHRHRSCAAQIHIPWVFIVALIVGLGVAFFMGHLAGDGDYVKIGGIVVVVIGLAVCLALKSKIWLILPITGAFSGSLPMIGLPLGVNEIAILGVFVMFIAFFALKVPFHKPVYGKLELIMFINLIYLLTVFIRNPVGVKAMDSNLIGGRPYFVVFVAVLNYWIFSRVVINTKQINLLLKLAVLGPTITTGLVLLTRYVPGSASLIAPVYSGVNTDSLIEENYGPTGASDIASSRLTELTLFGLTLNRYLCSIHRPLVLFSGTRLFHSLLFIVGVTSILLSGFRNSLIQSGFFFCMASYFYGGMRDVVRALFLMLVGVIVILVCQGTLFKLPPVAQRTLSFLPARWTSQEALSDARGSVEWRQGIWKRVWSSDRYIKNKAFGDGFGYTKEDLAIQMNAIIGGPGYIGGEEGETQMITGAFHSGPLSAVRYVGVVGFFLYLWLMIVSAQYGWKLIKRTRATPFFGLALFAIMPVLYKPFDYVLIFGGFDSSLPFSITTVGVLRILDNSLRIYQDAQAAAPTKTPVPVTTPPTYALARMRV